MKRKTKRRVGIILVIAMLAVLIYPGFSSIAEEESDGCIIDESGVLTGYNGVGGDVVIREGVTAIADGAFSGNQSITSVTIPSSVTTIGGNAFAGCTNLYCAVVPESVQSVGSGAFSGCSSLSDLTFSASVGAIADSTFYGCASLSSVNIPGTVTAIGSNAFGDCGMLQSVNIPGSVTSMDPQSVFTGCTNLSSITVSGGGTYSSVGGCLYNGTGTTLWYCPEGVGSVSFPNSLTSISDAAMRGCRRITELTIPDSVTSVGSNAFADSAIQTLTIPSNVTAIGAPGNWNPELIYTYSGSTGEEFAISNNYEYVLLDAPNDDPGDDIVPDPRPNPVPEDPKPQDPQPGDPTPGGTTGGGTTTTVGGSNLATNGIRSARQVAGAQHVLDSTPKTGPELNAKVVLCGAVFFVGVYLIISSRKEDEEEQPA